MSRSGHLLRIKNMKNHKFLFSHIATAKRIELVAMINDLDGTYMDSGIFENSFTHLICGSLKKNEKFIGACITGKWILMPEYIVHSHTVGMWLEEEDYVFRVENKDFLKDQMALSAKRWWIQCNRDRIIPFKDWSVSVLMTAEKASVLKRLLRYGGAEILSLQRPFFKCSQIRFVTYMFVDELHAKYIPELRELGILCLKETFLSDYILKDPPPDPFDYIATELPASNASALDKSLNVSGKLLETIKGQSSRKPVVSQTASSSSDTNPTNTDASSSDLSGVPVKISPSSSQPSSAISATKQTGENTVANETHTSLKYGNCVDKPVSSSQHMELAVSSPHLPCRSSSCTPSTKPTTKGTENVPKSIKRNRYDRQDTYIDHDVTPSKKPKKLVLEYLDPNLPTPHSILPWDSQSKTLNIDKMRSKVGQFTMISKPQNQSATQMCQSEGSKTGGVGNLTSDNKEMKERERNEVNKLNLSEQKRQNIQRQYSGLCKQLTLPASIYLPQAQAGLLNNETSEIDNVCPPCESGSKDFQSEIVLEENGTNDIDTEIDDVYPPCESDSEDFQSEIVLEEKGTNDIDTASLNSAQLTPPKIHQCDKSASRRYKSPRLLPNVYLYGLPSSNDGSHRDEGESEIRNAPLNPNTNRVKDEIFLTSDSNHEKTTQAARSGQRNVQETSAMKINEENFKYRETKSVMNVFENILGHNSETALAITSASHDQPAFSKKFNTIEAETAISKKGANMKVVETESNGKSRYCSSDSSEQGLKKIFSAKRQLFDEGAHLEGNDKNKFTDILENVQMAFKTSKMEGSTPVSKKDHLVPDKNEDPVQFVHLPHVSWPLSFTLNPTASNASQKHFLPPIVSQWVEASRQNGFHNTALDHGRPTLARQPNADILKQLVLLLYCGDITVKNETFSDLMSWAENHSPTNPSMVKVFSDFFEISTGQAFLFNLFQGLTEISSVSDSDGYFLLLEFTVAVFEMNFNFCLQNRDKKIEKECLLVKWLWSHSQAVNVNHNTKTKQLLKVLKAVLSWPQSTSRAIHSMSILISLVAECFRLSSVRWNTQNRKYLSDTVTSFALDTAKTIRDACPEEDPFYIVFHIQSFKPSWFRTMLTAAMLSFFNDYLLVNSIQVRDISLRNIVTQYFFLLPPLSSQQAEAQKSAMVSHPLEKKCSTQYEKNLTPFKVNKRNGKGESALHSSAIQGDVVKLKKLLSVPGVDVNLKDNSRWTPLHEACNHGNYACVELLLKFVPPNTLGSFFQRKDSVSNNVDINALGYQNITPLHDAVLNNHVEICKLLLKYGGKCLLETKTELGNTALDLATTDEMKNVLDSGWNSASYFNSLNLSQDSQSEDSLSMSQSDIVSSADHFPSDCKYDEVVNTETDHLSACYLNCSVFISLISLLLTSYFESMSVTQFNNGRHEKISLLTKDENSILRSIKFYLKVFKRHLKKITTLDTFESLQPQLLMLSATTTTIEK